MYHPKSCHSDIKYHVTLNIIFSVARHVGCIKSTLHFKRLEDLVEQLQQALLGHNPKLSLGDCLGIFLKVLTLILWVQSS